MLTRNKILSHAILILLLISAFPLIIHVTSENVSAAPDTHTWDGGGVDVLASTANNWVSNIAPEALDSVVWDAGALPCTWDLAITLATVSLNAGYSGTVTQGAVNFGYSDFSKLGGEWRGLPGQSQTCSGNFICTGGATLDGSLKLIMTGTGKTLNTKNADIMGFLDIEGNITYHPSAGVLFTIIVLNNGILTIDPGRTLHQRLYGGAQHGFTNNGIINGAGTLWFYVNDGDKNLTLGNCSCSVTIEHLNQNTANRIVTLLGNTTAGALSVFSSHAVWTMTLDLSASNYALSCTDLAIGTGGILNGRGSTISCSGNWDSSAGSFIKGYSTVYMTGVGKTLKTVASTGFWNLVFPFGSSTTLQNNVWAEGIGFDGALTQAGKLINVSGAAQNALTATGSWDGDIYLNGTGAFYSIPIVVPFESTARIFSKVRTTYTNGSQGSVTVTPAVSTYGGIRLTTINKAYAIGANWSYVFPSGTVQFEVSLNTYTLYQMYVDDVATGNRVQTGASGIGFWNYSVVSESNFTVMGEGLEISSNPITTIVEDYLYLYIPTTNYTGVTWGMATNATWLSQYPNGTVYGTPSNLFANQAFYINVTIVFQSQSDYQNFSLTVTNIAPVMTTGPDSWIYVEVEFQYSASFIDWTDGGQFTGVTTNFTGDYDLDLTTGLFTFRSYETGTWYFNITFDDMTGAANATGYQYFVVEVIDGGPTSTMSIIMLLLALVVGFGFLIVGFKLHELWILAGIIWIVSGLTIFIPFGGAFLYVIGITGIGLGIVLMFKGVSPYL